MTQNHRPQLWVFLGAGGVGKTTLSASVAMALASQGKRVGLLSIDPARRLQGALGVEHLPDEGVETAVGRGTLRAAVLNIHGAFYRWMGQSGLGANAQKALAENPLFRAVVDKMATSLDTFAAVRIAEWLESDPPFDHVVIDTAPGIHAIDFLNKPSRLMAFLDSKLVDWLKWFVQPPTTGWALSDMMRSGAKKILDGLAQIGGKTLLTNFGHFLVHLDLVFVKMVDRLKLSQKWLLEPQTRYLVVAAVRRDAALVAQQLHNTIGGLGIRGRYSVLNRCHPIEAVETRVFASKVAHSLGITQHVGPLEDFITNVKVMNREVKSQLEGCGVPLAILPAAQFLDGDTGVRQKDLEDLGRLCLEKLELTP